MIFSLRRESCLHVCLCWRKAAHLAQDGEAPLTYPEWCLIWWVFIIFLSIPWFHAGNTLKMFDMFSSSVVLLHENKIVLIISHQVIANKDCGVLMGNWSNCYGDGTAPTSWCGSSAILKQYYKCGGIPVKYGQSLAFAGVTNTRKSYCRLDEEKMFCDCRGNALIFFFSFL